ncbi:hypothetical protein U1Q18_019067 [Sarracenia purpurea var. burkii]
MIITYFPGRLFCHHPSDFHLRLDMFHVLINEKILSILNHDFGSVPTIHSYYIDYVLLYPCYILKWIFDPIFEHNIRGYDDYKVCHFSNAEYRIIVMCMLAPNFCPRRCSQIISCKEGQPFQ